MKHRVLVVEDDPAGREMLCDWLELQGFRVDSASNLSDAYLAVEYGRPEVVLLDVKLGQEDGLSLTTWMREHREYCPIPVIAVTAHAMVTEQERILKAGCNACISKPIAFDQLANQLKVWLTATADLGISFPTDMKVQAHHGNKL